MPHSAEPTWYQLINFVLRINGGQPKYFRIIATFDPYRIKFGDEKHLKGKEVFNRRNRRNPFTGHVPPTIGTPDLTNTYSLTGFCGIDRRSGPVFALIHEARNGAEEFAVAVELAVECGWFHFGDVFVLDNATIHNGGENTVLQDWMWGQFGIVVLFLPPRSPELNPIELVWNAMVEKLKTIEIGLLRQVGSHCVKVASTHVLRQITHEEVEGMYVKAQVMTR